MSAIYDNWERLVAAAVKKQQLWELFHAPSRSPSVLSEASDFSSSSRYGDQDLWWQEEPPKLVLLSDFSPGFDFKDVSKAFAEFLGSGTFGSAYSATLDNGVKIVAKRLKSGSMSELEFKRHMHVVGNVRHGNIAPLRAYYASGDERILLYDYYSEGSLYALLHGQTGGNRAQVSWETRLTIAVGVARAIAEIHKKNGGRLVHGNIKSSNVFISPMVHCCVSDLGLANMIETTFMPGAKCHAPEVKKTNDISQASDVYSFGILLLELITRKPSIHVAGGPRAVDLAKLVRSKSISKVFDADQSPTITSDMIELLQVGMMCAAKTVKKRPYMSEVVKMLEGITKTSLMNQDPGEKEFTFLKDVNPKFNLEDALKASAEILGRGTFGTSYKVMVEYGNTIVVKRLRDVIVSFNAFHENMVAFGRMNHNNVADIMAYYFSRDEKLVVYHYYQETSISALLHGTRDTGRTVLGWKTRLKIAMDAATGIAHIHESDEGKLVHGNITSSNIFFLKQNYAIVADGGYTKLSNPISVSAWRHTGYRAPEVIDIGRVSQASDVYSFGVFLLELASGLPLQIKGDGGKVIPLVDWFGSLALDEWISKVVDKAVLRNQNGEDEEGMIQYLQIARDCVTTVPRQRPKMPQVVEMLEEISGVAGPTNKSRREGGLADTLEASMESRLENLLVDLLPTLTP